MKQREAAAGDELWHHAEHLSRWSPWIDLYERPDLYDEDQGDPSEDVPFYEAFLGLIRHLRVAEVGAGAGRLSARWAPRAAAWYAIEPSAAMRARLRDAAPAAIVVDGALPSLPAISGVDRWILPFQVLNHLRGDELSQAFAALAVASAGGARLALDAYVWTEQVAQVSGVVGDEAVLVDGQVLTTLRRWPCGTITRLTHHMHDEGAVRNALDSAGWCVELVRRDGPKLWLTARRP